MPFAASQHIFHLPWCWMIKEVVPVVKRLHYVLVDSYMENSIPKSDTQRKVTSNNYLIGIAELTNKDLKEHFQIKKLNSVQLDSINLNCLINILFTRARKKKNCSLNSKL
jgi:hypothetical protein